MKSNPLKALFSSETRIKVLSWFFLNPDSSYYARQLEKTLKTPVSQLRRELINLVDCGFLSISKEGNQVRYSVNKDFTIYEELRSSMVHTLPAMSMPPATST